MKRFIPLLFILFTACRKESPLLPGKPLQIFPANNEVCAEGNIISADKSSITFRWKASDNTDSYGISVKNLETGEILTGTTDQTFLTLELKRNTPYSWFILSKNTKSNKEASSDVWKFYNAGPAATSYAPFPADLISPRFEEVISASTVTFRWSCIDTDGDIAAYDVYLGTAKSPPLFRANITETTLANVPLPVGTTYYWKIVATDKKGNKSHSDIYSFKLN